MSIKISHQFDAGAIEVLRADDPANIALHLRQDNQADIRQWFYFRVQGARGTPLTMNFLNAGVAAYPKGWEDYQAVASYDRAHWFRVPTSYDGQVMRIAHTPEYDSVYYAYFEPYSWERHLALLDRAQLSPLVRLQHLGSTIDGRDLDLLVVGNPEARQKVWILARQHPGETMAEWLVEGFLEALLDQANPFGRQCLANAVFYIVPNMNPDGAVRGNLRTNATGANLNREWLQPSMERSPEVFLVKKQLLASGCDLFLDMHGDEGLPYVFVAGAEALPDFTPEQAAAQQAFIDRLLVASPDFQHRYGYGARPFGPDTLAMATPYIAHHFGCVALTLEMPFKDNANDPDPHTGWNGARSKALGRTLLQAILPALAGAATASK